MLRKKDVFPKSNFQATIPKIVKEGDEAYQKDWFRKAEDVSTDLFSIAEDAIATDPNLNVIIVKRLPRFDRSSSDWVSSKSSQISQIMYMTNFG